MSSEEANCAGACLTVMALFVLFVTAVITAVGIDVLNALTKMLVN